MTVSEYLNRSEKARKKVSAATIAKLLLEDERRHFSTGYDSRLGIDLAHAVLRERKRIFPFVEYEITEI